jgi:hypothetical protein
MQTEAQAQAELAETQRSHRVNETLGFGNLRVAEKNAQSNARNAATNERNATTNARNAATNARNAEVNAFNAGINARNASTNAMNAATARFTAEQNALEKWKRLDLDTASENRKRSEFTHKQKIDYYKLPYETYKMYQEAENKRMDTLVKPWETGIKAGNMVVNAFGAISPSKSFSFNDKDVLITRALK